METFFSKIKQPAPNISENTKENIDIQGKKYKIVQNNPHIGVIQVPKTTKTPLRDWIEIKRREQPYTVYKVKTKDYKVNNLQTFTGVSVIVCGVLSLLKLFKK